MSHKLMRSLILLVAMVCVVATMAVAADMKTSGTVWNIDDDHGVIVLRATDGKRRSFNATGAQMSSLNVGDSVEITVEHGNAKSIHRVPMAGQ